MLISFVSRFSTIISVLIVSFKKIFTGQTVTLMGSNNLFSRFHSLNVINWIQCPVMSDVYFNLHRIFFYAVEKTGGTKLSMSTAVDSFIMVLLALISTCNQDKDTYGLQQSLR